MSFFKQIPSLVKAAKFFAKLMVAVFLALLMFECFLRVLGGSLRVWQKISIRMGHSSSSILCVGDSFVYGVGGRSFPVQLQEILDEKAGKGRFKVYNEGVPGTSTFNAVDKLPGQLARYKPSVVIFLSGNNNYWNGGVKKGAEKYLMKSAVYRLYKQMAVRNRKNAEEEDILATLAAIEKYGPSRRRREVMYREIITFLENPPYPHMPENMSLVERLGDKYFQDALRKSPESKAIPFMQVQWAQNFKSDDVLLQKIEDLKKISYEGSLQALALYYFRTKNFQKMEETLALTKSTDEKDRLQVLVLRAQLELAKGNSSRAFKTINEAIKLNRGKKTSLFLFYTLAHLYSQKGDWKNFIATMEMIKAQSPRDTGAYWELARMYNEPGPTYDRAKSVENYRYLIKADRYSWKYLYVAAIVSHMTTWKELDDAYGLSSVLPPDVVRKLERAEDMIALQRILFELKQDDIARDVMTACELSASRGARIILSSYPEFYINGVVAAAEQLQVPYIDFMPLFRDRFPDRKEWIGFDNAHCNTAGYRFMAEEYAKKIEELCPGWKCSR